MMDLSRIKEILINNILMDGDRYWIYSNDLSHSQLELLRASLFKKFQVKSKVVELNQFKRKLIVNKGATVTGFFYLSIADSSTERFKRLIGEFKL